MTYYLWFFL